MDERVYVALLDEGVDVWRPTFARGRGDGVFLIIDQPYDRGTERWQFEPGSFVRVEKRRLDAREQLVAVSLVGAPRLTSEELAELVVDALLRAGVVEVANVARAVTIATEEIEARKGVGDY